MFAGFFKLRRVMAVIAAAIVAASAFSSTADAQSKFRPDTGTVFMQKVARDLIKANRSASVNGMHQTLRKYAAINILASYSLGSYMPRLSPAKHASYKNGMLKFMARYFAKQSQTYKVAKAVVTGPSKRDGNTVLVPMRVTLTEGSNYDIQWALVQRGRSFKIRDAQVVGFWLSPFQRNLFRDYVRENGGNVNALVVALNQ